ncbi:ROK family protein [Streptomyces radicis]|uniref:ROK family protein n=1 Tax=Streptomyces radicis TaxID=1750517 RepID=A0A3A9VXW2_9ACTN|nr:ROK family protein [Streptomyces radicis]RKN05808.1 ROK family protein [Streptomyces radicis]RKN17637.1 ROK family protein [Streptomyces radicis]
MRTTSRDIRTANRYRVLRQAIADSPASRPRLAEATGLSPATVATLVGELLDQRMLVDAGFEDSGGGRPRGLLAVNPEGGALIGVDVAETYVHVEVVDLTLRTLARAHEELYPRDHAPAALVRRIGGAVRAATAGAATRGPLLGAGISMPGMVDREGGVSVYAANWGWHDVPLLDLLSGEVPSPLYLDNPMRACLVAELWFGAASGHEDAVVVNLGTGVGAGLALGGALHRGASNSAGEWGHTQLVLDGRPCHCGRHGCVESYVGAPGIMRTLREIDAGSPLLSEEDQTATVDRLARAHGAGDPVAARVFAETGGYLGAALADLVNLLDPEVIILTGWVARALGTPLLDEARAAVARHALSRPLESTEIVLSPIRVNPVSLGAATFALEGALASVGRGRR